MTAVVYNGSDPAASALPKLSVRLTRAQLRALSPFHRAVALVYIKRGTGEVELIEDAAEQSFMTTGA